MSLQSTFFRLGISLTLLASALHAQTTGATFGTVINLGGTPADIVLDEARSRLYSVNSTANRIDIVSTSERKVIRSIAVGNFPLAAALSPDNGILYVTNTQSASLTLIDLGTDSVINTISLPAKPEGVAVGADGRVLITTQGTGTNNALNTLLLFDRAQASGQQIFSIPNPPTISTPAPLPAVFAGRPATAFPGRLSTTPDGNFIVGMVAINQNANTAQTTLFVYEAASGTVIRNRTVTGQSTILSMSPDGSKFMAGSTLYDTATLAVVAQMSTANFPFFISNGFNPGFNVQRNLGGSAYSLDGRTLYSAFNTAATTARPVANVLYVGGANNLSVRLGLRLRESILGVMKSTLNGSDLFAISESGLLALPIGASTITRSSSPKPPRCFSPSITATKASPKPPSKSATSARAASPSLFPIRPPPSSCSRPAALPLPPSCSPWSQGAPVSSASPVPTSSQMPEAAVAPLSISASSRSMRLTSPMSSAFT